MTRASGVGSLPGTDIAAALRFVRDRLVPDHLPHLPELPARGPGADIIGRSAGLLVELPVDLQPSGWRFVDRPGRDASRTAALWRQDLDELAEAFDGYVGELKLQVAGPWTLAASIELNRGERAVIDDGAAREIVQSLAAGVAEHLATVQRLVPGATLILQLDEPSLPAVLAGALPTASGYGRIRAVDPQVAAAGIRDVLAAAGERGTVVHCCHRDAPIPLLRNAAAGSVALDVSLLTPAGWESVAASIESGMALYAGALATDGSESRGVAVDRIVRAFERVGLPASELDRLTVTPACGISGLTSAGASSVYRTTTDLAAELTERAHG